MQESLNVKNGLLFEDNVLAEIRDRFCLVDIDADGTDRLFFENAGGSLRLKSTVEISNKLNQFPDCYARDHKSSLVLQGYEAKGREALSILFNAKDGEIATNLTASMLIFDIVGPIVEYGKGTNIVTSVLEHPSAFDACRFYGEKFGKEIRVAQANQKTGAIDADTVLSLVDENTLLINVIAASNITGAITDLKTIITEARKINPDVFVVTDAVQHAPHAAIDVDDLKIDGINIAPYKFFGTRGISFAYVSERVKNLPHKRIIDDDPGLWELGSIAPAQYAALAEVVDYVIWIGAKYINSSDKRELFEEGMRRIHLHERALLHRLLYGGDGNSGLISMEGVETFFDYSDITNRDLIVAMRLNNLGYFETVREYEKRGIIVYERVATSAYSKRMVEAFELDGVIRVSPLHCNTVEEIDKFLEVTKEILTL